MVNAEFNWWLLIVGLVVGAGIAWLVLADLRRSDEEVEASELEAEAAWIAGRLAEAARPLSVEAVEAVLRRHREYLALGPAELDAIRRGRGGADGGAGAGEWERPGGSGAAAGPGRTGESASTGESPQPGGGNPS
ncbi:MAG TPA: hypothetical protein VNO86_04710 [Candidatus Binatia bacterium]|nr:hypothetical protein [Candidatus Binatia bacterium]